MLVVLPIAVFLVVWLDFAGRPTSAGGLHAGLRAAFLQAATIWGLIVVFTSEALSALEALLPFWLAVLWGGVLLLWLGLRYRTVLVGVRSILARSLEIDRAAWVAIGGLVSICAMLLAVAWISPPNNVDSLLYHASRVAHWAQNRSLRHYATGYHHQLAMPPWSEMAILHFRLLAGSDKLANLVQWFSMIGSLAGVSAIAGRLGAGRSGQLLAAAFAVSIPMGVLQSTSTQNDYVVAFWLLTLVYFVISTPKAQPGWWGCIAVGAALGLAILTKATAYVYVLPWPLLFLLYLGRRHGLRPILANAACILAVVVAINAGYWARNYQTYGTLFGPAEWVRASVQIGQGARDMSSVARLASRVSTMMARNLTTPLGDFNQILWKLGDRYPGVFGRDYSATMSDVIWSHEDTAGNPLHLLFVPIALITGALLSRIERRRISAGVSHVALGALAGYLTLALFISNAPSLDGLRFQLPFFVLWGAVVGSTLGYLPWRHASMVLMVGFLTAALPWVLLNNTRPIIGMPPWPTRIGSVFTSSRQEILFSTVPWMRVPLTEIDRRLEASTCRLIGLRMDSPHPEYPIWFVLQAPESGYRLETIYTYESLEHLIDTEYQPCAIICTICPDRERLHGMPLRFSQDGVNLYQGSEFSWDPDA